MSVEHSWRAMALPRRWGRLSVASTVFRRWVGCQRGVAALEFGLCAPALGLCLLATVDFSRGISERMQIDHILRAGAQSAMSDPGAALVHDVMWSAAAGRYAETDTSADRLTLTAARFCACPEDIGTAVGCSTQCSAGKPTFTYYRMTAHKAYTGALIPTVTFDRALQVQVR